MSILSSLGLAASVDSGTVLETLLLVLVAASAGAAVAAGALPPRRVNGPDRIPPGRPAWPLLAVLFGAVGVYFFSMSLYLGARLGPTTAPSTSQPSLGLPETAVVSVVPPLLALVALVLGDRAVHDTVGQDLGLDKKRLAPGVLIGLWGGVIVVPPLLLMSEIVEMIYRALHYEHPVEHPVLHALGERPGPLVTAMLVVGACVIAPLFEEMLFRGHVQTLLRRALLRLSRHAERPAPPAGFPVIIPGAEPAPPPPPAPARPTAWQTWLAIVLTSVAFALLHPAWTQPMIFALSLALGYAYERTGDLWVSITIHAVFNSVSTIIFLSGLYSR